MEPKEELPIDVPYKKLAEWLSSRQKLVADWSKRLAAIAAKASDCFKELSPDVISQLKGGPDSPLDYLRAVEIRDLLAKTAERTLFGGLSGPAAEWDKIVKAYEKGGIHLGEAALNMVQNAEYELPYLRKQAAKLRQVVEDAERREVEYTRSASTSAAAYHEECKKLGITAGPDVRRQLAALAQQLPTCFSGVLQQLESPVLADAITYYQQFSAYAHSLPADHAVLTTLCEVREGRTAPPPPTAPASRPVASSQPAISWDVAPQPAQPSLGIAAQPASGSGAVVDISWDISAEAGDAAGGQQAGGISWDVGGGGYAGGQANAGVVWDLGGDAAGEQGGAEPGQPVEIAWDIGVAETEAGAGAAQGGGIDWGIDMAVGADGERDGTSGGGVDWGMYAQEAPQPVEAGPELSGADAAVARLCADGEYRASLGDDLLELRAFLTQRRGELSGSSNALLLSVMPEALQAVDGAGVAAMSGAVEGALSALRGERLAQLLMLAGSTRYVERLAGVLARKAAQESKMMAAASGAVTRGNEAKVQLMDTAKKVLELVERTRAIKAHAEGALNGLFPGRRVVLMGEINSVLASTLA